MGGHYGSLQVKNQPRERIIAAAEQVSRERGIKCLVGPALNGWVGVYPEENGQDQTVGEAVARLLGGDVIHLIVHDDDIMAYWLWRDRQLVDSYWSTPGYFGEKDRAEQEAMEGRPEILVEFAADSEDALRELLRRDSKRVFQSERLESFAQLLGIRNAVTAYEYLKEGETEGIKGWKQFEEIPRDQRIKEQEAKKAKRKEVNALIKQLKASGALLVYDVKKQLIPHAAATRTGFLVAWHGMGQPSSILHYSAATGAPEELFTGSRIGDIASDASGGRIAITMDGRVNVLDTASWKPVYQGRPEERAVGLSLSGDGKRVADVSREGISVTEVDPAKELASFPVSGHPTTVLHPSGEWLVAASLSLGIAPVRPDGKLRWLCVGGRSVFAEMLGPMIQKKITPADIERAEQEFQLSIESSIKRFEAVAQESKMSLGEQQITQLRAQMQQQWEESRRALLAAMEGHQMNPPQGEELPVAMGFIGDGERFWCGTDKGLRIYRWEDVLQADGANMPAPLWHFDTPDAIGPSRARHVYAAAEEPEGKGLIFGGISGRLYRMDLTTGAVVELRAMPEKGPILRLMFSHDGIHLGVLLRLGMEDVRNQRDQRGVWSVWSFTHLRQGEPTEAGGAL